MRTRRPRGLLILVAFALFLVSIQAIRAGGQDVRDAVADRLESPVNAFGLSWVAAYLALSGSPVAALAVTLHADAVVDAFRLFAMLCGSRLGAEAIVLVTGAIAYVRTRGDAGKRGIEVGLLAFLVSFAVYLPALAVGSLVLLRWTPSVALPLGTEVASVTDYTTRPLVGLVVDLVGPGMATLLGLVGLWSAFRLFEGNLPRFSDAGRFMQHVRRMFLHPSLTFLLGAAVTFVATTVSISMTLLVPLHMQGYVTRGQLAAYMLGASVTTLVDTLLVAVVARDPVAQGVLLLLMGLVALFAVLYLVWFRALRAFINHGLDRITRTPRSMMVAGALLVGVPVFLALI